MTKLRHAWLIMAHGNYPILERQIRFLDSENADIFVHMDADGFPFEQYRALAKKSTVTFLPRKKVFWGDLSQIECELRLLEAAAERGYDYYHLLSGVDVPIKSRSYIENYFSERNGTNFVKFQSPTIGAHDLARIKYFYPLQKWNIRNRFARAAVRELTVLPQRIAGVNRTKKHPGVVFQKGTNWFDITDGLARYVLSQKDTIRKMYRSTCCADEIFLQTIVMNSRFVNTLTPYAFDDDFRACCRYIDWKRGNPYTFGNGDFDELASAGPDHLFARKFDYSAAPEVVDRLFALFGESAET